EEQITVRLSGVGIAIQRAGSDRIAVGTIDPAAFSFVASDETEFWAGTLRSDIIATYTEIGTSGGAQPTAARGTAIVVPAAAGDTSGLAVPWLPDALNRAAEASDEWHFPRVDVCRPVRYSVKTSDSRFPTEAPPQYFDLPKPEKGFDQNQFANNY